MIQSYLLASLLTRKERCSSISTFSSVDSTNTVIRQHLPVTAGHFSVVTTEYQTAGRGRMGRHWIAPAGAHLTFSLAIALKNKVSLSALPLAVAVGLVNALSCYDHSAFTIKWPNDIWYHNRKIAGILIENMTQYADQIVLIIGIGLNIQKAALPDEATCAALEEIASLKASRTEILATVVNQVVEVVDRYLDEGFEAFQSQWQRYDALKDRMIVAITPHERIFGHYLGILADGRLKLLADDGRLHLLSAADVSVRASS